MTRLLGALFGASISFSAAAHEADPQIIITADTNPAITHAKLVDAASRVCDMAIRRDAFGDFGSREECIDATMHNARVLHTSPNTAQAQAVSRNQREN